MLNKKKLAFFTSLALVAAVPGLAAADRDRRATGWQNLGEVGTHTHDAEDYITVRPQRLDALQLRARDRAVAVDGIQIQFSDGRTHFVDVHQWVRPGQPLMVDLPESRDTIKMLVVDYGNKGPYWRARETAHLQVLALADTGNRWWRDGDRDRVRTPVDRYRRPAYDRSGTTYDRDHRAVEPTGVRYEIRGGVRVRIQ